MISKWTLIAKEARIARARSRPQKLFFELMPEKDKVAGENGKRLQVGNSKVPGHGINI